MTAVRRNSESGFSMAETLVSSVVLAIVLLAVYTVYDTGLQDYARGTARADIQQNVRVALESMARELRLAGFNPATGGCANPPLGAVTALSSSPVSVTFRADVDGNNCADQVTYTFVPPTDATKPCDSSDPNTIGKITRSVQAWNGAWNPTTPVEYDIAQCVRGLTITYVDSAGNPTTTPASVRRITISITGEENTRGWGSRTYVLSSDVTVRNPS